MDAIPDFEDSLAVEAEVRARLAAALGPKYVVRERVGQGGFCDVYEVWDTHLERRLAVKLLRTDVPWGPGMNVRFEREARALGTLNHLNIPPVHFVGDKEGLSYFAMSFIEGDSLADRLAGSGPFEHRRLVELMIPVLEALGHAHRRGIVHRDIKPDNIIVEAGSDRPVLVDFGVAKDLSTRVGSSLPGVILGTPAYISPEQVLGENVDHRSDIYAVGSTIYHLLTGQTIFSGEHPRDLIRNQLTGEIPVPTDVNPGIPLWLSSSVLCALERRPEDRFQSAAAMAEALRAGLRMESEESEWVEPSFAPMPFQGGVAAARRATDAEPPPWLLKDEDLPAQTEHWGVQLRWVLATIAISLVLTWVGLVPMQLVLRNSMLVPISVHLPRGPTEEVSPGGEYRVGLGQNWKVALQWDVNPTPVRNAALGDALSGSLRIETVDIRELFTKRIYRDLNAWSLGDAAVAPRVVNQSSAVLFVRVVPATASQAGTLVERGDDVLLGYYRWDGDMSVEVRRASGELVFLRPRLTDINEETGEYRVLVTDSVLNTASNSK